MWQRNFLSEEKSFPFDGGGVAPSPLVSRILLLGNLGFSLFASVCEEETNRIESWKRDPSSEVVPGVTF